MAAVGFALFHIKKTGTVDKIPVSEEFIGDPYTGMVHGGVVTSFLDSLIDMRFVPIVCRLGRTATLCFGNPLLPGVHGGTRGALLESTATISLIGAINSV